MNFSVNDSPFAGQEGKFVTSRQVRKRLYDEFAEDEKTDRSEKMNFKIKGGNKNATITIKNERERRTAPE